jgi:hypothetical protein
MKVYHCSVDIVTTPEIRTPNRSLDYGAGFYATTSYKQAEDWVRRRMKENKAAKGYVNIYELDETAMETYNTIAFTQADEKWVDFVMSNRMNRGFTHDYDIVYGPVANDNIYASFALYEQNIISKRMLIEELRTYRLVDQYLFHTQKALSAIRFIEAKEVNA